MSKVLKLKILEYKNGNHRALGDILAYRKEAIKSFLKKQLSLRTIILELQEDLGIVIKYDTLQKWVQRNINDGSKKNVSTGIKTIEEQERVSKLTPKHKSSISEKDEDIQEEKSIFAKPLEENTNGDSVFIEADKSKFKKEL